MSYAVVGQVFFSPVRHSYLSILLADNADIVGATFYFATFHLWFYHRWSWLLCILYNRFFPKLSGLSDRRIISMTKNEYGSTGQFLYGFLNSSKSISDKLLISIFWSSPLFGIFLIKKYTVYFHILWYLEVWFSDKN